MPLATKLNGSYGVKSPVYGYRDFKLSFKDKMELEKMELTYCSLDLAIDVVTQTLYRFVVGSHLSQRESELD